MELDNGDNIDTSILILNENDNEGLAGLEWGCPCFPPGKINVRRQHKDSTDSYQVL